MKVARDISVFIMMLTGVIFAPHSAIAASTECKPGYYAATDSNYLHPLQQPDPEFMKSYNLAMEGNAKEQRNLAVSYDAGYLVHACADKAYYWYQQAAKNGDSIAQEWITRYDQFKHIFDGPELAIRNAQPRALQMNASLNSPADKAYTGDGRQTETGGLLENYTQNQLQPADPTSDFGKLVKAGQILGGLVSKPAKK